MKRFAFILILMPLYLSTTSISMPVIPCDCPDDLDTTYPADSMRKIYVATSNRVEDFIASKQVLSDSLRRVADSLTTEVMIMERDSKRRRVVGRVDQWRDAMGRTHIWRWYYHRYRDGEMRYDTTIKRTYNGIL